MREITLVTGGARSGKSSFALDLAGDLAAPRLFLATAPYCDPEMTERIRRHQDERDQSWTTVEEQMDLVSVIKTRAETPTILLDCLSLWIGNHLHHRGAVDEDQVRSACMEVVSICRRQSGHLILVSNETGMGIVPDNALARRYRDLLGRCNQTFAAHAQKVFFLVSGLALTIK